MKRKLFAIVLLLPALWAYSQTSETEMAAAVSQKTDAETAPVAAPALAGDSLRIRTIDDVVGDIRKEAKISGSTEHYDDVWARRSYFNLGFNFSTLAPKDDYATGVGNAMVEDFKSNFGFSLKYGRSYRLHKKPISNVLQFYIDYTGIDLNFNHYALGDGKYDSSKRNLEAKDDDDKEGEPFYIPWNLEKFEGSYGMMVGPSLTVAPFTHLSGTPGLHFLKLNMYFHVGYQFSILYMKSNDAADINLHSTTAPTVGTSLDNVSSDHKVMSDLVSVNWGHGVLTTFGLSLTWKNIGIGYEHRVAHNRFKPFATGDSEFGSMSYKFKTATNRVFLTFRLGK